MGTPFGGEKGQATFRTARLDWRAGGRIASGPVAPATAKPPVKRTLIADEAEFIRVVDRGPIAPKKGRNGRNFQAATGGGAWSGEERIFLTTAA
ncbi:hypothetical protein FRZ61_24440 [Hypericibacter adhaerens]|uniref:Uncharacterized protein n=1 Tax=Hypericibacter adhaerens TaxID=2602016 RepID=A0A5J6MXP7_9PROT|nr:hypothetical protein FRZ61_24440 [Hypericibacter adhaerens]